jgi:hypothetical protein
LAALVMPLLVAPREKARAHGIISIVLQAARLPHRQMSSWSPEGWERNDSNKQQYWNRTRSARRNAREELATAQQRQASL